MKDIEDKTPASAERGQQVVRLGHPRTVYASSESNSEQASDEKSSPAARAGFHSSSIEMINDASNLAKDVYEQTYPKDGLPDVPPDPYGLGEEDGSLYLRMNMLEHLDL